jgi:outer membrane translocation and assembly module TamA
MNRRLPRLLILLLPLPGLAQQAATASEPLQVQEVRCSGNTHTSCEFIRDHLYLHAGEPLNEEEVRNAELRLSALRNFEAVNIHLEKGAQRGAVIVVIDVEEANPIAVESIAGFSYRLDSLRAVAGGRIANQNLFGRGKYLDLRALAVVPMNDTAHFEAYDVTLRYADPQLFDSSHWFGVASAGWKKRNSEDIYGNRSHLDTLQFDVSVGRRFGDFSYFIFGLSYRPQLDWIFGHWQTDGEFTVTDGSDNYEFTVNTIYGWSSEDDLHFPTQGSTFQLAAGGDYGSNSPDRRPHVQFRKTWEHGGDYWTLQFGGDPSPEYRDSFDESQLLALTWSRPIAAGNEIRRGRWYIEPGFGIAGVNDQGDYIYEAGLKVGFRADTRTFGLVNLYLMGSLDPTK